jgi:hypothetical protein
MSGIEKKKIKLLVIWGKWEVFFCCCSILHTMRIMKIIFLSSKELWRFGGVGQVVELHEALSLNPSTENKKKKL